MDTKIFYLINRLPHDLFLNGLAQAINYSLPIILVILFLINFFAREQNKKVLAKTMLLSLAVNIVVVEFILKNLIQRARPFTVLPEVIKIGSLPSSYSFPSNHAALIFAVAATYLIIFPKKFSSYLVLAAAIIISLNRIYMGHHYPTDLAAGAVIGSLISGIIYIIYKRINKVKVH